MANVFASIKDELAPGGFPDRVLYELCCVLAAAKSPQLDSLLAECLHLYRLRDLSIFKLFQLPPTIIATEIPSPNVPDALLMALLAHDSNYHKITDLFVQYLYHDTATGPLRNAWIDAFSSSADGLNVLRVRFPILHTHSAQEF